MILFLLALENSQNLMIGPQSLSEPPFPIQTTRMLFICCARICVILTFIALMRTVFLFIVAADIPPFRPPLLNSLRLFPPRTPCFFVSAFRVLRE